MQRKEMLINQAMNQCLVVVGGGGGMSNLGVYLQNKEEER